ncbi:MAG: phosphomannomutase/phosphoglucomutase [Nitrospinae bacterium]|nr:phosphomannomutase/phosphoglucomutase [Nitrospinota bacterium]
MNSEIFREYDIRGMVGTDLTDEVVTQLGQGIGTKMRRQGLVRVSVSRDVRLSSEGFSKALISGLRSTGVDVVDLGLTATPILYYSLFSLDVEGGIMITGSHNPPEFNGFKVAIGDSTIHGKEIQEIREIIEGGMFAKGEGRLLEENIVPAYLEMIKERIKFGKKLKVVLDAGNGVGGMFAPQLIRDLGCEVVELYCEPDGHFPNHFPDPTVEKNLLDLIKKVKEEKADVGIAYDGDADRIGVVDEKGGIIWGDQLMVIFAREILSRKKGARIVFEVKCSQNLPKDIEKHGGVPVMSATGHSLIKNKMKEVGAELAGEMSGHIFFSDGYHGFDDAIYASCRLLQILSNSDQTISDMLADLPKTFTTPEIRIDCPDSEKFNIVADMTKELKEKYNVVDVDGARVIFEDGWGLIRASNTQPILVLRFESLTPEGLERMRGLFYNKIKNYPVFVDLKPF